MLSGPEIKCNQKQLCLLLDMISHASFLNFNAPKLFLKTAGSGLIILGQMLQEKLEKQPPLKREDLAQEMKGALEMHQRNIPLYAAQFSLVKSKISEKAADISLQAIQEKRALDNELAQLEGKKTPIDDYDWAVICKLAMQNGEVLNRDDQDVSLAFQIFLEQIQLLFADFKSKYLEKTQEREGAVLEKRDEALICQYFVEFVGQLCLLNDCQGASIIHHFLHLANCLMRANQTSEDKFNPFNIGMTFSLGLFDGLKIFQSMGGESSDVKMKNERQFFALLTAGLINMPIFATPFAKELYEPYAQAKFTEVKLAKKKSFAQEIEKTLERRSLPLAVRMAALSLSPASGGEVTSAPQKVIVSPRNEAKTPRTLARLLRLGSSPEVGETSHRSSQDMTPGFNVLALVAKGNQVDPPESPPKGAKKVAKK